MKNLFVVLVVFMVCTKVCDAQVKTLTSHEFFTKIWDEDEEEFINRYGIVIDFYATWCKPCHTMSPIFNNVARMYSSYYDFYRIDIDEEELAEMFEVNAIPMLIYIPARSDGTYYQTTGLISQEELIRNIKRYLSD
jgi:thioredoxin-like negative regulator of GroEL